MINKKKVLPGGESNPGLPRDRRGYSPLYYRGLSCTPGQYFLYYFIIGLFSLVRNCSPLLESNAGYNIRR